MVRVRRSVAVEAPLAMRFYTYEFLSEFVLLTPVYALLFADTGLSVPQMSALFALWSVASFSLELPFGVLADLVSRRMLLMCAPALTAVGFALWTVMPSFPAFAAGFVFWSAGNALRSGTVQALVYDELARQGRVAAFPRLLGRARAWAMVAVLLATVLASPLLAIGGYTAVGFASITVLLLCVPVGGLFPQPPQRHTARPEPSGWRAVLGTGLRAVRQVPAVRSAVLLVTVLLASEALKEYVPLLARETGLHTRHVPLAMALFYGGSVLGGWWAGRGTRWTAPVLAAAAVCLAASALLQHPAGLVGVTVAFGAFTWAAAAAEARLQEEVDRIARATVISLTRFGKEVLALAIFASYGLAAPLTGHGVLYAVAAAPYLLIAVTVARTPQRARRGAPLISGQKRYNASS